MHPNLHHGGWSFVNQRTSPCQATFGHGLCANDPVDKPHLGAITEKSRAQDSVDMVEIMFGADVMEDHVCIMANVNTNSPLLVDRVVSEAIQVYSLADRRWL